MVVVGDCYSHDGTSTTQMGQPRIGVGQGDREVLVVLIHCVINYVHGEGFGRLMPLMTTDGGLGEIGGLEAEGRLRRVPIVSRLGLVAVGYCHPDIYGEVGARCVDHSCREEHGNCGAPSIFADGDRRLFNRQGDRRVGLLRRARHSVRPGAIAS